MYAGLPEIVVVTSAEPLSFRCWAKSAVPHNFHQSISPMLPIKPNRYSTKRSRVSWFKKKRCQRTAEYRAAEVSDLCLEGVGKQDVTAVEIAMNDAL